MIGSLTEAPDASPRREMRSRVIAALGRPGVILSVLLILAGVVLTGLVARNATILSPYDEQQHLDYAVKAGNFDLPDDNEFLGQTAMRETACRGIDTPGIVLPACDSPVFYPADFPDRGYNTASQALPGYYFPTGLIARAVEALTPVSSPLLAIRLVSAMWLGAGLAVMMVLALDLGATTKSAAISAALFIGTPVVVTASTKATPDSMLLLCGAVVLLATVRWRAGRIGLWAPAAAAVVAMTVDRSNVLALVLAGVYVVAPLFGSEPIRSPRLRSDGAPDTTTASLVFGGVAIAGVVLAERVFPEARRLLTGDSGEILADLPRFTSQQRPPFGADVFLGSFPNMVSPVARAYAPEFLRVTTYRSLTTLLDWLLIGGALGTAAWAATKSVQRRFGVATAAVMVLSGPMISGAMWLNGGLFYPLPSRYGLPMMPALGVTLALSLRGRALMAVGGALAVVQLLLFSYYTVTAA